MSANDPLNILSTSPPALLKLTNIASRPSLNGQFCHALSFSNERYTVALIDAPSAAATIVTSYIGGMGRPPQPQHVRIHPASLVKASKLDEVKLSAMVAWEAVKLCANHEKVVDLGRRMTPHSLRGRISPLQTLAGLSSMVLCGLVLLGYWIGFNKLVVALSLLSLLAVISSPDWMEGWRQGKPFQLVLMQTMKNLSTRWKEMLVQATGRNISNGMASGSLVLIMLWTAKLLITPVARREVMMPHPAMPAQQGQKYDLDFIYKLGYDDGKSGADFGSSLPEDVVLTGNPTRMHEMQPRLDDSSLDWEDYNPTPPLKPRPSLGMGTLLSMFALFRFGKELITYPDGRVIRDPNLILLRLKSMEPWRLGLIFMSLYRVIGALSSFLR
ncbi:hypothetical protein HJC23_011635 [Cyclotella cryptica]|uniref:Uncharacterized protein n=1 Tax=Cyclotella cryptica TaxID=29204 RepID=A0ABD3QS13_9STRA|eukprot:CCRYP_002783-RA/>CCRYP_002783-RA protein AED:0.00 eAED:-0.00 QI:0/-1/0/1/-1/1/1/0/384